MRYGLLSTHPPTRCGLATFNSALAGSLTAAGATTGVVRVTEHADGRPGDPALGRDDVEVTHTWSARQPDGWRTAADALNVFDVAIIQFLKVDFEPPLHVRADRTIRMLGDKDPSSLDLVGKRGVGE